MPYYPNDERWPDEYHVSPRYLAGPTFTGDPALRPLLDAGWNLNHDDLGNVYVNSPDQKLRLGYLPEGEDDALWQITAYSNAFAAPRWLVTYKDSAPTEIVTGFTTALAKAHAEGPDSYLADRGGDLAELNVGTPLVAAGWSHRFTAADVIFESPDGLAEVHLRRNHLDNAAEMAGNRERWLTLAGPPDQQWYATASSHTPPALVTAMNWALTDPAPVIRYGDDVRLLPPQAKATPVTPPAPTPLDVRRAHAARARSPIGHPAAARHSTSPAARQHSLPKIPAQLSRR
ncbi:DUF317 domain-containing protein [Kitasatospora sp. NPDC052896]|uniref:DUF317 domain-containing protein n=1 Tax=Kitasatospora sp. NPDC052896 TaxID=3364061 RepID=UPI0037C6EF90